jgi:YbaB/EbfC DNA-binding family
MSNPGAAGPGGPTEMGNGPDVVGQLTAVRGDGEAAGGQVKVVLDGTSNLVELVINPRAMRLGSEDLVDAVTSAFAAARESVRSQLADLTPAYDVVPEDTQASLDEIQLDAERRLDALSQIAEDLSTRLDRFG